jgi:hypothetical protein
MNALETVIETPNRAEAVPDVVKMPDVVQETKLNVPKWQLLKSYIAAIPGLHKVNEYVSVYELIQGRPDLPKPTDEDSKYLKIYKTWSQDGYNLEAKLREHPEAVRTPFLLWSIEHFSDPTRFPEIFVVDRELMFTKYEDIVTPFLLYYFDGKGSLNVVCGPGILYGQRNSIFELFERQNASLQVLYYTSEQDDIFPDVFGTCRYALAGLNVYYETIDPDNRLGKPVSSTSLKRDFWTRGGFVEDYRDIIEHQRPDRILLTRENYKTHLSRIPPLTT